MDVGTQISLEILVSLAGGVIGAIGAYIRLKSSIDVLIQKDINQQNEINDIKEAKKDMNIALDKRIDSNKLELSVLQKEMSTGHNKLETAMAQMELRIVKEIQKLAK
jgi:hypothetical protein